MGIVTVTTFTCEICGHKSIKVNEDTGYFGDLTIVSPDDEIWDYIMVFDENGLWGGKMEKLACPKCLENYGN